MSEGNGVSIKLAILSYSFLVIVQFIAYWMTGISVLFAQALEMLSDIFVSAFLLLSINIAKRPADSTHMFGYGRAENVVGLVSAVFLIAFMSVEALRESIPKLVNPKVVEVDIVLGVGIVALSMMVVAVPLISIIRSRSKGGSIKTQLISLIKDEAASGASLVGLGLVSWGYSWGDALASTVIGILIALSGVYLFRENAGFLMGRSPDKAFFAALENSARSVSGVLGVHDVKAEYVGPGQVHAGIHIEVAVGTPIEVADGIADLVEAKVSAEVDCSHCLIHVDPLKE